MEKLQANLILEILGRPVDHVKESLNALVIKLGSEKGVKLMEKNLHDPLPVENSKDLFTAFAEVLVEFENLENYFGIVFAYMPSNIELIHPEKIPLSNVNVNDLANKIINRLHEYDAITKKVLFEKDILTQKIQEAAPHLFPQSPNFSEIQKKQKPKRNIKN